MDEFVISGAAVFDGERALGVVDVTVRDGFVAAVGTAPPDPAVARVDGRGATLLPGLIDAHVHTTEESARHALAFGVTTELDMVSMPQTMVPLRRRVRESFDLADVRSASVGLTPPGGHPHQLRRGVGDPEWPTARTVAEVPAFVDARIAEGADYLKVLLEDGRVLGEPVPELAPDVLRRAVEVGHDRGLAVLAHALTRAAAAEVVAAGADGLTHLFVDVPADYEIVSRIADSGAFVVPTLTTLASITSCGAGAVLADEPRVSGRLPRAWIDNLRADWATLPRQNWDHVMESLGLLREAGIDVLAGTDAAHLGAPGTAHGASLHDELLLLTEAGWSPAEALRAATALPAHRFGLVDRGRVAVGRRADLLLVDGDPTRSITDTLSVRSVWRHGHRLDVGAPPLATR